MSKKNKYDTRNYKINKKKYIKMIDDNRNITKNFLNKHLNDVKKTLIKNLNNRFTIYKSVKSNKQFITIYNSKNIIYINKLFQLLNQFVNFDYIEKIKKFIKKGKSDRFILKKIKENLEYKNINYKNILIYVIAEQIKKRIEKKKPKVLDFGIGNGKNMKILGNLIDIKKFGTDIKEWGPYKKRKFDFTFKYIQENPYKIPYKSNYFDCIIISFVLHHVEKIEDVLKECKRILKKDGILILIEHNVWNDYNNMIINIQHRLFSYIFNEVNYKPGSYYNIYEWDYILNDFGFYPIYGKKITVDINKNSFRYDNQHIGIYKIK